MRSFRRCLYDKEMKMVEEFIVTGGGYFKSRRANLLAVCLTGFLLLAGAFGVGALVYLIGRENNMHLEAFFVVGVMTIVFFALAVVFFWDIFPTGRFAADLTQVTFKILFWERQFFFSEIEDVQVETKYIVRAGKRRTVRYFAEKITITAGGKTWSCCAKMDCNVEDYLRKMRAALRNEAEKMGEQMTFGQLIRMEQEIRKDDLLEERLEYSIFLPLKRFIEENK